MPNTYKIIHRSDRLNLEGKASLALRIWIGKRKVIVLPNTAIKPGSWDQTSQIVLKTEKDHVRINALVQDAISRCTGIFATAMLKGETLTVRKFEDLFKSTTKNYDFIMFLNERIKVLEAARAKGTIINYNKLKTKLLEFKNNIDFGDLNFDFIERFNSYLSTCDGNEGRTMGMNTIAGYHKNLKFFINQGIKLGIIESNPYKDFKVKKAKTKREFLTSHEILALIELYKGKSLTQSKKEVLRGFLFMCFTSLRFSELSALEHKNIRGEELVYIPEKFGTIKGVHTIQLNDPAKALINHKDEKPFKIICGQNFNRYIKTIVAKVGIKKNVTAHVARHTFATQFLANGGDIQVLQEIMNHEKIETTMVYIHLIPEQQRRQVDFFNDKYVI